MGQDRVRAESTPGRVPCRVIGTNVRRRTSTGSPTSTSEGETATTTSPAMRAARLEPITVPYILHLHRQLFRYTDDGGGQLKTEQNLIASYELGHREILFTPPSPRETQFLLPELVDRYGSRGQRPGIRWDGWSLPATFWARPRRLHHDGGTTSSQERTAATAPPSAVRSNLRSLDPRLRRSSCATSVPRR